MMRSFTSIYKKVSTISGFLILMLLMTNLAGCFHNGDNGGDGPGTLQLSSATYSADEGTDPTVTITVTRTGGSSGAVTVNYATADGTANDPSDYTSTSGTLNWADGDAAAKTFTIAIVDDNTVESTESFSVTLSNAQTATLGTPSSATVSITDNEVPGTLQLSSATYSADEGTDPTVTITVTRTGGSSGAVTVNYATADGTATATSDYTAASGTLNWADGVLLAYQQPMTAFKHQPLGPAFVLKALVYTVCRR